MKQSMKSCGPSSTFLSENSSTLLSSTSASAMVDGLSPVTADSASSEILSPEKFMPVFLRHLPLGRDF